MGVAPVRSVIARQSPGSVPMLASLALNSIVHVAALLTVVAMLFRSPLVLRALLMASTALYIVYYFVVPSVPLWDAIFWSVVMLAVNGVIILRIVLDRTRFAMAEEARHLHARLAELTPGQLRRLVTMGTWRTADEPLELTREGDAPGKLYFVVDGSIEATKGGRRFTIEPGFIGEISFLRRSAASATVTVGPGARLIEWPAAALARCMNSDPSLKAAMGALLNNELARKVAQAS
jgi:CRP-like cAMP-binding protein